jgi:inosine/xanthosine triphosphatase
MKINIGSKNKQKVEALREILKDYPDFPGAEIISKDVSSDVADQPKSLDETIKGAMNRAKNAFDDCEYSFGLESGLMAVPETKTGYMDFTACAIYDGKKFHLGLSSAFEYPIKITKYVLENNDNISNAFNKLGLTKSNNLGSEEGAIGILTRNRLTRKSYTKEAIRTALIHLENKELYDI